MFLSKILHITHSQWIFCNFMLHKSTHGLLHMREKAAILVQIESLALCEQCDLPEESRFLLEFDIGVLKQADLDTQCYWVAAVDAAKGAIEKRNGRQATRDEIPMGQQTNDHHWRENTQQITPNTEIIGQGRVNHTHSDHRQQQLQQQMPQTGHGSQTRQHGATSA